MAAKLKLPLAPGRYVQRNGAKVHISRIDQIKASDGTIIPHAFGYELVSGQSRMWDAKTGQRIPQSFPGAKGQDIVERGRQP